MPKSAQQIVKEKYPQAEAVHHPATHQMGQSAPTQEAHWAIYVAPGLGQRQLATGPTEHAAWVNASTEVLKDLPKPTTATVSSETVYDAHRVGATAGLADAIKSLEAEGVKVKKSDG